jgi:hypothetical protein
MTVRTSRLLRILWVLPMLLLTGTNCFAQVGVSAYLTSRFESNSNVYLLENLPQPGGAANAQDASHRATMVNNIGQLIVLYPIGQQALRAEIEGSTASYRGLTGLDHTEYRLGAGFDWKLKDNVDGSLDYTRIRKTDPFTEVITPVLPVEKQRLLTGTIGLYVLGDWRLALAGKDVVKVFSQRDIISLQLTEKSGHAELLYGRLGRLRAGLATTVTEGEYVLFSKQIGVIPTYRQYNSGLILSYASNRFSLNSSVGYTKRHASVARDSIATGTGSLGIAYRVSGKTHVEASVTRDINSYISGVGSELVNVAAFAFSWQTSNKVEITAQADFTRRVLPGQGNAPIGSDRTDDLSLFKIGSNYDALPWLRFRPYVTVQSRSSDFVGASADSTAFGIDVILQRKSPATK